MYYPDEVLARFDRPVHAGQPAPGPGVVVMGQAGDLQAGIRVVFRARLHAGRIASAAFQAWGCPHAIAACSLIAERLQGAPVAALQELSPLALAADLDWPVVKRGRLLVIEDALRSCWRDWDNKRLSTATESGCDR